MSIHGPFFDAYGASRYCGATVEQFKKWIGTYVIATCGPNNRYAASTLDEFMADPEGHRPAKTAKPCRVFIDSSGKMALTSDKWPTKRKGARAGTERTGTTPAVCSR